MSSRLQLGLPNVSEIGLIGAGRLGTSLACALEATGQRVVAVASTNPNSARALAQRLSAAHVLDAGEVVARAAVVLLTLPDALLASAADGLPWRAGQAVVHCSGAFDLSVLEQARAQGALAGCLHPLQTFPERFLPKQRFNAIACGIEGDGALHAWLEQVVASLGARSIALAGVDRALYHAAAVFAGNYVAALQALAEQAFVLAGLPAEAARPALAPLTLASVENLLRLPIEHALTGPLARGDATTIAHHLSALERAPALRALYVQLARVLLARPLALSAEQRAQLLALLA